MADDSSTNSDAAKAASVLAVDLTGIGIPEADGVARRTLAGRFTSEELGELLVEVWIPYFECHHCGRFDYCKFVQRVPGNPRKAKEIRCGIAATAVRSLVNRSFPLVATSGAERIQHFMEGAFHFFNFVYYAETHVGLLLNDQIVDGWNRFAPMLFGQLTMLRVHLERIGYHFGHFEDFNAKRAVLLVEGWSEKTFLSRLSLSGDTAFRELEVHAYGGRGNRRPNRIEMLLEEYRSSGQRVYVQGDSDGQSDTDFQKLINRGLIGTSDVFVFVRDFESSFPPQLLYSALRAIGELEAVTFEEFELAHRSSGGAVGDWIEGRYDIDWKQCKIPLAEAAADILNETARLDRTPWRSDEAIMASELGQFLDFVVYIWR